MRTLRADLAALALVLAAPALSESAVAEPSAQTIAGHRVEVVRNDKAFQETLKVDGKPTLRNAYVSIDEVATVAGVAVAIGSASNGGNACDAAPFVLSFPANKRPHLDGPLDTCKTVSHETSADHVKFQTVALEGDDGQAWIWTPARGFKYAGRVKHEPDPARGWSNLAPPQELHPGELLDFGGIAPQILSLLGASRKDVLPLINGVGSGKFEGALYVGSACRPHACPDAGVLIVADPAARKIYLAWKLEKRAVERRPAGDWPAAVRRQFDTWAKQWRD